MDWLTTLRRSGGINALSRQLGVSPVEVAKGAEALLPALIGGLRQRADSFGIGEVGVQALIEELKTLGGGELAADVMMPGPLDTDPGKAIIERALGPEVARKAVLIEAERASGLDQTLGEQILPGLAMLVGGYITARAIGSGIEGSGGISTLGDALDNLSPDRNGTHTDRI